MNTVVLDTSVLLAILLGESDAVRLLDVVEASDCWISTVTRFEASLVVLRRLGPSGVGVLDRLCDALVLTEVPFSADHARTAFAAYRAFGKGRHPAALNFGDCCSYALARVSGSPLLFKGGDFAKTDVPAANW